MELCTANQAKAAVEEQFFFFFSNIITSCVVFSEERVATTDNATKLSTYNGLGLTGKLVE